MQERDRLPLLEILLLSGSIVDGLDVRKVHFARVASPMSAHDSERHAEDIGPQRARRIERRPVAVENEEYLVRKVFDLPRTSAQPPQSLENVVELAVESSNASLLGTWFPFERL